MGRDPAEPAGALRARRQRGLAERRARASPADRVALPTYPFQRRRHWIDAVAARRRLGADKPIDFWSTAVRVLDRESARGPLDLDRRPHTRRSGAASPGSPTRRWLTRSRELGAFRTAGERHTVESLMHRSGHRGRTPASRCRAGWTDSSGRAFSVATATRTSRPGSFPTPRSRALGRGGTTCLRTTASCWPMSGTARSGCLPIVTGRESALESLFPERVVRHRDRSLRAIRDDALCEWTGRIRR